MRRFLIVVSGIILLLGAAWFGTARKDIFSKIEGFLRENLGFLHASQAENPEVIRGTGTIEVREIRISSKTSGYIGELRFSEGDLVRKGDLLARIDRPDLEARKAQEEASLRAAKFLLADMRLGARPEEVGEVRALLEGALARYEQARKNALRFSELQKEEIVSPQKNEEFQTTLDTAASDVQALEKRLEILRLGARQEQIRAQEATVEALEAAVGVTESLLKDTRIYSPRGGRILFKNVEEGEYVAPGSILGIIGDMQDCWVRLYIPSVQLGKIRHHQKARIRVDSFPERFFPGYISEIAGKAAFTPRESLSEVERSNLSFRVKIQVPNPEELLKPGMPADVEILP
jgi:HlyD family secretion protein